MRTTASSWRFPAVFWSANIIELFERAAHYGTFLWLTQYLTAIVGFTDVESGWVGAAFASVLYLLPTFLGAVADRIGYRRSLLLAFTLLSLGYAGLGLYPHKLTALSALFFIMVGGAFVKPIITGTVARSSGEANRARAYSLFYMMVNVGSFSGKALARPVRMHLGFASIPLYSAVAALIGLVLVALFYFPKPVAPEPGAEAPRKSAGQALVDLLRVLSDLRFLGLILITAGFWAIQGQLYASMPKYVIRLLGPGASPEWFANINPLVVVLLVVPVTQLARRFQPIASIALSLTLVTLSPLCIAVLPGFMPLTVAMVIGIAMQGLAECFLSPRYYEYASKQAPPGQEGLFLGYSYLNNFFSYLFGFVLSGYLLDAFCPDPRRLSAADQLVYQAALAGRGPLPAAYAHAHYLWYVFAGIGLVALLLLLAFQRFQRSVQSTSA